MKEFLIGHWGTSSRTGGDVSALIGHALWPTLQLMTWGILLGAFVALSLGVYSAVRQYSIGDYTLTGLSYLGISLPAFWFGLVLIQVFAVWPVQSLGFTTRRCTSSACTPRAGRASTWTICATWRCRC